LEHRTGQTYSRSTLWRALRSLDDIWKRPRYVLAPDPEREKKTPDSS
jgi:transposase